ncbi:MAG: hypothetical protein LBU91_09645 [Bacteroidales bacterium]|jgi:predicted Zn-dependent protease|nr:hypothetical protein [Bacteroidales bacterium]
MKKTFISIIATLLLTFAQAQNNDALIFNAMQTELDRSKTGLKMPNMPAPFFINYIVAEGEMINITASLGSVVSSRYTPVVRSFWGRVMTESNKLTNDGRYNNQGLSVALPIDDNLGQLRRDIWMASDMDYKKGLEALTAKKTALRKLNKPEETLLEYETAAPIEMLKPVEFSQKVNKETLETLCKTLSGLFVNYPKLYASKVQLLANQSAFYNLTSEGTKTKQPLSHVVIKITAKVRAEDGAVLSDYLEICAADLSKLPTVEQLSATVNTFATELQAMGSAEAVNEYYSGPVLFEDAAVADMFLETLLAQDALIAYKKPVVGPFSTVTPRNIPVGRKLIDTRFTVINHTQMSEYNGQSLVGAYAVDGEGVVPAADQVLVEKGLLKSFLNNRIPTEFAPKSNGNNRIGTNPAYISTDVKPAVLEIQTTQGLSNPELRERLINSAKEEGLSYAYIVRKLSGVIRIYQVDVATGKETLMRSPEIAGIGIARLKRVDAVSADRYVENVVYTNAYDQSLNTEGYPMSIICPKSLLLQDIEINKSTANLEVKPSVMNPLER